MDFERLNGDVKEMRRRNRGLGLAVGVLAAGQILALIVILNLLGTVRTVVVPPSIDKTFWVTRDKAVYKRQGGTSPSCCWTCNVLPLTGTPTPSSNSTN